MTRYLANPSTRVAFGVTGNGHRGVGAHAKLIAALTLCLSNVLSASAAGHDCAAILDDANRLACYDRAFGSPHAPLKGAGAGGPADAPGAEASKKDFSFSAAVTAFERRGDGKFLVTLDNQQVWSQVELNSRIEPRVGDTVKIRRGALGSYLLSNEAGLATRVKRVR